MASSLAETLKAKIEHDILAFTLKPGDRLDECRLADLYGSSRTPVREALRLLAAEGLVSIRPHRGAVVSGLTIAELNEMFEMMAVYEGVCARLAALHVTPEELSQIASAHEACRVQAEADDIQAYCLANARFHETIYQASHNRYLIERTIATRNRLGAYRRFRCRQNIRIRDAFQEHQAVFAAIEARDADKADRVMRGHIASQSSHITGLIARLPREYFAEGHGSPSRPALQRFPAATYPAAALAFE